jgi:hypothetical protein
MHLSHRQLPVVASETSEVKASASSLYRVMKKEQLMENTRDGLKHCRQNQT